MTPLFVLVGINDNKDDQRDRDTNSRYENGWFS
jgi:hypothetical protein